MDTLSMPQLLLAAQAFNDEHHLLQLKDIAPPPTVLDVEESCSSSSNGSNIGEDNNSGSGFSSSFTCSFPSSSAGQLTPPFTPSPCSSSSCSLVHIADHQRNHGNNSNVNDTDDDAAADLQAEPEHVAGDLSTRTRTRTRQNTSITTPNTTTRRSRSKNRNISDGDKVSRSDVRRYAAEIVRREAKALLDLAARFDPEDEEDYSFDPSESTLPRLKPEKQHDGYSRAIEILKSMDSHGRIIMTGVGKSGLLARKAVATFNSFGIPSAFLHPVEALHGDMGLISPYGVDTVILISYSGRTAELLDLLNHLRQRRVYACISLSSPDSALAEACDVNIDVSLENDEEAEDCVPAPTSSVVTALAALDALALTLLRLKTGWNSHISERRKAFGLHHPGGSLGQQLSTTLEQTSIFSQKN